MNDLVRSEMSGHSLQRFGQSAGPAAIRERVNAIQEVMQAVMKKDVHYGVIPGCKKPSLYKPGSEVLLSAFQIATSVHVTDLSNDDCVRYQVRVIGTHQGSGVIVGEGIGECSSNEEKYKWRKANSKAEFDGTPETRRRVKYGKDWSTQQVRAETADVANTILKMAKKRAQIDMTLTTLGASDCFDQDIEDLPEELVPRNGAPEPAAPAAKAAYPQAQFDANLPAWTNLITTGKKTAEAIIAMLESKAILTVDQKQIIKDIKPENAQ